MMSSVVGLVCYLDNNTIVRIVNFEGLNFCGLEAKTILWGFISVAYSNQSLLYFAWADQRVQ